MKGAGRSGRQTGLIWSKKLVLNCDHSWGPIWHSGPLKIFSETMFGLSHCFFGINKVSVLSHLLSYIWLNSGHELLFFIIILSSHILDHQE